MIPPFEWLSFKQQEYDSLLKESVHQRGPTTEDYHSAGSQTLTTWKVTSSQQAGHSTARQPGRSNRLHLAHRRHVYVKKKKKRTGKLSCILPTQSGGAASQMQIHSETWAMVLDESDEHPCLRRTLYFTITSHSVNYINSRDKNVERL